jgi:RNA polymerase sigma-70 factor (ECF subfamily)
VYWKPVYAYLRARWRKSVEDAKDLTQAFFTRLLERGALSRPLSRQESFRGFLKTSLRHFVIDEERATQSRRPELPLLSLDRADRDWGRGLKAPGDDSPERAYDRAWLRCLIEGALEDLEERLVREGKALYLEALRGYVVDGTDSGGEGDENVGPGAAPGNFPTYRQTAQKLGITESDVRNYLSYCRRALREAMRRRIARYVEREKDVEPELREVLGR